MRATVEYAEDVSEIQEPSCNCRCERSAGEPPCGRGKVRAIEVDILVAQVEEAVDQRQEQVEVLRRFLARQVRRTTSPLARLVRDYEVATGTGVSCD